ncbi:MAG: helix-turn-helix domain-containing protein [Veillonellaceae bacterium]|nr:helix-turn-helix domain-containing protein [Veillonellaceae bacterium]
MNTSKINNITTAVINQIAAPTNGVGEVRPLGDARHIIFNNTVSHSTILRMAKRGEFPAFKLLGGKWYFIVEIAQAWLAEISMSQFNYRKGA